MPLATLFYRARIRNAADSADDLVITSLPPSGTNPFLTAAPTGDGGSLDILTGAIQRGALQIRLADAITSGPAVRVLTSILADASGKQQLLSRLVIVEESTDGTSWATYFRGYLTRLRLITAMEWELTIGEVTSAEQTYLAFAQVTTAFPKGVNIIGEPITGGWGPMPAIGQTTFKVLDKTAKRVRLQYQFGPLPPDYVYKNSGSRARFLTVNKLARPFAVYSNRWTNEDATVRGYFPRLNVTLKNPTTGALVGVFNPIVQPATPIAGDPILQQRILAANSLLSDGLGYMWLDWPSGGSPAQPANGTMFAVQVSPIDVSTLNPLHVDAHPVDIWTALYTEAGIPWSASAASALKDLLGQTLRFRGRFTGSAPLGDLMAGLFGGPLGIGVRVASDGTRELISVRDLPTSLPGTTITVNELRNDDGVIFDLDDASVVNRVTWQIQQYDTWDETLDGGEQPNDLIVSRPITYATENGDAGIVRGKEHRYEVSGHFYDSRGATFFVPVSFFAAQAARIFDRFGRGGIRSEVQVLRGTSPALGSFVTLNLPHLPVAVQGSVPVSQRGLAPRAVQVERSRPDPQGPILTVLDIGRAVQPAVNPTHTLALSALDPLHFAEVTITNAAALAGAGIERINFQFGTGAGTPTGGIDFAARSSGELLTNPVVTLPKAAAGEKVWVRAQSKDSQVMFPGPWSAWQSVTLTALPAPSGLTVVAGANDTEKIIRWNLSTVEYPVLIRWKYTGEADWRYSYALPPGTVEYTIRDLIPGGGGISGEVLVIDEAPSPGASSATAFSFTPGAVSPSLPVPWSPAGWSGSQDEATGPGVADGTFGLDVTAAKWPAYVEVEVAVETGIGTGVYGTYVTASAPLVNQGYRTRTRFAFYAANDRLRRKLRARHTLPGYTSSGYTAEVVVSPWVPLKAIIPAIAAPTFAVSGKVTGTIENPTAYLLALYATPDNPHFDYVRYRVRQREIGSSTWGEETIVVGGRDGDDLIPVQFGVQAEVRLDVINTDGVIDTTASPLTVNTPRFPKAELWAFDAGGANTGFLSPIHVGREPARLVVGFVPNEHTVLVEVYSEEHTTDPGDPRNLNDGRAAEKIIAVEPAIVSVATTLLTGVPEVISLPLSASGNYRLISIVPYDRLGRIGAAVNMKQQGDATALPSAPSAASNVSVPAGGSTAPQNVRNSVTPSSSVNTIRLYRNGRFYKDFGPGTSGVAQNDDNLAVSEQVDRWEYCHYTGTPTNPRESARTTMFVTTTPTLKLAAVASFAAYIPGSPTPPSPADVIIAGVAWTTNNPLDTYGIVRRAPDVAGSPGAWTEVATLLPFQDGLRYTPGAGTWWFSVLFRRAGWTDSNAAQLGPFAYP